MLADAGPVAVTRVFRWILPQPEQTMRPLRIAGLLHAPSALFPAGDSPAESACCPFPAGESACCPEKVPSYEIMIRTAHRAPTVSSAPAVLAVAPDAATLADARAPAVLAPTPDATMLTDAGAPVVLCTCSSRSSPRHAPLWPCPHRARHPPAATGTCPSCCPLAAAPP